MILKKIRSPWVSLGNVRNNPHEIRFATLVTVNIPIHRGYFLQISFPSILKIRPYVSLGERGLKAYCLRLYVGWFQ